jgi:putative sigma-54 modulation protein
MSIGVEILTHGIEIPDRLKEYVEKKAKKLDRYLNEIETVRVELSEGKSSRNVKDRNSIQITVRGHGILMRVEERGEDIFKVYDSAIDKMQRQLERYKGKHFHARGDGRTAAEVIPLPVEEITDDSPVIARHKTFELIPMSEAEALEQMKLLGHDNFFIFYNIESNSINVLYLRRDGTYGLIEPRIG